MMKLMKIDVGCKLEEYKSYYKTLDDLHNFYRTLDHAEVIYGKLGPTEEQIIKNDPSHLIVWREGNEIIGHTVWHETTTDEHKKGDPRDPEDRETLREICGGKQENIVELHELWLRTKYRGKGYGKRFFEFFETFIKKQDYDAIVYYTNHPAAITICRNRGWKEGFLETENWHVFSLSF
jgi:GNAT superfamily N-acetyltransferase